MKGGLLERRLIRKEAYSKGGLVERRFIQKEAQTLVVDHIPAEIFLPVNYFFDATHTSNMIFLKEQENFVT